MTFTKIKDNKWVLTLRISELPVLNDALNHLLDIKIIISIRSQYYFRGSQNSFFADA